MNIKMTGKRNVATIMIICLILLALTLSACGPSKADENKAQVIGNLLKTDDVPYTAISSNGKSIEIFYESSDADNFDSQMVADWASIFATAALFNYTDITIVNTINYMPAARLSTSSVNVNALANGLINESIFWNNVDIKAEE
jgi:hypothetical protein